MTIVAGDNDYIAAIQAWRQTEDAHLRAEDGWLTVVGLEWLKEGVNTIGGAPSCDVALPGRYTPDEVGLIYLENGQVTIEVTTDEPVLVDEVRVMQVILQVQQPKVTPSYVKIGSVTFFIIQRGDRYAVRIRDANSTARHTFGGRCWFPIDTAYRVTGRFIAYPSERRLEVETLYGIVTQLANPGVLEFELHGQSLRVEIFHDGDDKDGDLLWLIFRDATSGISTYGASRFLKVPLLADGTALIDFNRAYHPPCAFTHYATCPLPPRQNVLPQAIKAGERLPD